MCYWQEADMSSLISPYALHYKADVPLKSIEESAKTLCFILGYRVNTYGKIWKCEILYIYLNIFTWEISLQWINSYINRIYFRNLD